MCSQNDKEDDFQFIFKYPFDEKVRKKFNKRFYYVKANVYKLVRLLCVDNTKKNKLDAVIRR